MLDKQIEKVKELISKAEHIVIVQADNPDGDSLASSLALEAILGDQGKKISLYCGVQIPNHLRHLKGWDRVSQDLPASFDLSIIVDTSSDLLLEKLSISGQKSWLTSKPCLVIDHHPVKSTIGYATINLNEKAVATSEIIYEIATKLDWSLSLPAMEFIAVSILADSLGLMSEGTTVRSIRIIADLVEKGVNLAELENRRREMMRKSPEILAYKGKLLQRVDYAGDGRIAYITIPWSEISEYSPEYNPSVLVIDEMRLVNDVNIAIAFKEYPDGKITAKIRCNYGYEIANDLAAHFGGGGHIYASGFKIKDDRSFDEVKTECLQRAIELLDKLEADKSEAI